MATPSFTIARDLAKSVSPGNCFQSAWGKNEYVCVQSQTGHALAQDQRKSRLAPLHKQSLKSWFLKRDTAWYHTGSGSLSFSLTYMTSLAKLIFEFVELPQKHVNVTSLYAFFGKGVGGGGGGWRSGGRSRLLKVAFVNG